MAFQSFDDFWPYYVRAHSKPGTRICHYIGSALVLVMIALAIFLSGWFLVAAPVVGYGFAWFGHFVIEGNKPATFGHPFYSLAADYRMFYLMLTGRMGREVALHANRS